jgi:hypothetical protein
MSVEVCLSGKSDTRCARVSSTRCARLRENGRKRTQSVSQREKTPNVSENEKTLSVSNLNQNVRVGIAKTIGNHR